jgi:hypothetical protein
LITRTKTPGQCGCSNPSLHSPLAPCLSLPHGGDEWIRHSRPTPRRRWRCTPPQRACPHLFSSSFPIMVRLSCSHGGASVPLAWRGEWRRHLQPAPADDGDGSHGGKPSPTFPFYLSSSQHLAVMRGDRRPSGPLTSVCVHPQVGAPPSSGSAAAPFAGDRVAMADKYSLPFALFDC